MLHAPQEPQTRFQVLLLVRTALLVSSIPLPVSSNVWTALLVSSPGLPAPHNARIARQEQQIRIRALFLARIVMQVPIMR